MKLFVKMERQGRTVAENCAEYKRENTKAERVPDWTPLLESEQGRLFRDSWPSAPPLT